MIGQAFEAEYGEMNEAGLRESLAREGVIDASRHVALPGALEGVGLLTAVRLVPKVTPAKRNPAVELRPPGRILVGVGVEVADHEGATASVPSHPYAELFERLSFHVLGRHVDGRNQDAVYHAPHPVVLELVTLSAEALVGLQFPFTIDPDVTFPAMKGGARAVHVAGRCQARLIMLLAALKELGQDDDIGPPTYAKQSAAIDSLLSGIQEKDFH